MRRLTTWLIGVVLGGAIVYGAFQYHLVRTNDRWLVVPKQQADWREAFVDVRNWSVSDWGDHTRLSENLVAAGHGDVVSRSAADQFFRGLFDSFRDDSEDDSAPPAR